MPQVTFAECSSSTTPRLLFLSVIGDGRDAGGLEVNTGLLEEG